MDYTKLASKESVEKASAALTTHSFKPMTLATGQDAFEYIKKTIPAGASVMNGASTTLQQIGYVDYLKAGTHGWNNLQAAVVAEKDPAKQTVLRKQSVISDFYVGSVHAATETGELVIASNSGSQMPELAYTSPNLILIVSTKKIVRTVQDAFERIEKHVGPLEAGSGLRYSPQQNPYFACGESGTWSLGACGLCTRRPWILSCAIIGL